jgi:dCMP deaminase
MIRQEKWDRRFIGLAQYISSWSKDPSTQAGAVIVGPAKEVISVGYNGLPIGVDDLPERLNNREIKYKIIVHCERNAIIFARTNLVRCTLYTWPFMPCAACAGMVIQAGIIRCVAPINNNPRWQEDFKLTQQMFDEAGVELRLLDGYNLS